MSSSFTQAFRSSLKSSAISNKRYFSNLFLKKHDNKFSQTNSFKKYFSTEEERKFKDISDCKKLVCQTNKIESTTPKTVAQTSGSPLKCLYDDPECCLEKCPGANLRLDCLYYKMSDKRTRKYQQTWADCVPLQKEPKITCHNPFLERDPPLPIRSKGLKPKTACSMEGNDSALMQCGKKDKTGCIKIRMPGCRAVRDPPTCKFDPDRNCTKISCPFPAYSECKRPKTEPCRPTECNCLKIRSMCDIYAVAKRKGMSVTK